MPSSDIEGSTVGLVAASNIGRRVIELLRPFDIRVLVYDPYLSQEEAAALGVEKSELNELMAASDVVSLHCPLTPETDGLINAARLYLMKKSAFLINTSRGSLLNERDVAEALNQERIAGAGLDVLSVEPPEPDNPLLTAKNCIITPHIAWATRSARQRLLQTSIDNLGAFIAGKPQNVVAR